MSSERGGAAVLLPKRALTGEDVERLRAVLTERVAATGADTPAAAPAPAQVPEPVAPSVGPRGDSIDLCWTPAQRDWVEAFRTVSWFHRWARVICPAAALVGVLAFVLFSGSGSTSVRVVVACVVFLPVGAILWLVTELQVRGMFRRNASLRSRKDATVDDVGLHFTSDGSTSLMAWDAFVGWQENTGSFVLRSGNGSYAPVVLLPKRAVLEPATVDRLRATLRRHLTYAR